MLEELIADFKSGKENPPAHAMVIWFEKLENGRLKPHSWFSHTDRSTEIALLSCALSSAIAEMKDPQA